MGNKINLMKKKIEILLLLSCFCSLITYGQDQNSSLSESRLGVKVSYFGEFVMHPGFALGVDYSLYRNNWLNVHLDSEIGAYDHKWNNNSLFIQSTIGSRFTTSFSALLDINIGLGYMLSTPNGDLYTADNKGGLIRDGRSYKSHLKPDISLLVGWDGAHRKSIPLIIQAGIEAYWQSHFNHAYLPHAALRFGIIYSLKGN